MVENDRDPAAASDLHPHFRCSALPARQAEGNHGPQDRQPVSTSEAAKQLLESARDDRLELVNLLLEPTESLLRIRGKADARLSLSQAEWTMVAHYCALGAESFTNTAQGQISFESLAEILEAFLAAYAIVRRSKKSPLDFLYLMTLPGDKQAEAKAEDIGSDDVRRVVNHTIQMLRNPAKSGANQSSPCAISTPFSTRKSSRISRS